MKSNCMTSTARALLSAASLIAVATLTAQTVPHGQALVPFSGDSDARPPVAEADVRIVQRARSILSAPSKWNRADTRVCPAGARTFSLYCALETATDEVSGAFEHRGAAMQEARFVIEQVAPNVGRYQHRLMDYNNDPKTTFADIQTVFRRLEERIVKRLAEQAGPGLH